MEDDGHTYVTERDPMSIEGYHQDQIRYHLKIMEQAGYLYADETEISHTIGSGREEKYTINTYSISWQGHEFLGATRDEKRWIELKKGINKVGGVAFDVAFFILKEMGKQALLEATGLNK